MNPILEMMNKSGVVAIIRLDDLTQAHKLVETLLDGGIRSLEFTLTNPQAPQVIEQIIADFGVFTSGEASIGAGSVLTAERAKDCIKHGAQFIVSPNTSGAVINTCITADIPVFPGAYTPTEIQHAWEMGASAVKVFPARALGPTYLKDVRAPMPHLRLVPTGGVSAANIADYKKAGAWAVGVGGNLVSAKDIASGNWGALKAEAETLLSAWENA